MGATLLTVNCRCSLIYESTLRRARRRRLCVHNLRLLPVDASPSFHTLAAHSHGNRSGGSWTATLSRPAETLPGSEHPGRQETRHLSLQASARSSTGSRPTGSHRDNIRRRTARPTDGGLTCREQTTLPGIASPISNSSGPSTASISISSIRIRIIHQPRTRRIKTASHRPRPFPRLDPRARARSPETLRQKLKEAAPQHGVRCEAFLVSDSGPPKPPADPPPSSYAN